MLKAYKYCIYPTDAQKVILEKHFGCVRFVYNWGLSTKNELHEKGEKIGHIALTNKLAKELKPTHNWLNEVNSQCLQMSLRNLDAAYQNFFRRVKTGGKAGFPKFKSKKDNHHSFQCPQHTEVDFAQQMLNIVKVKDIPIVLHRKFRGTIKTTTISKTASGNYYASILVDTAIQEQAVKPIDEGTTIGIDTGIKSFLVCSNGKEYENNRYLQKSLRRLILLQRRHVKKQGTITELEDGRKVKTNSKNREKSRIRIAKLHDKVGNQRLDYIHKITHELTHDNQVQSICVEDLNIKGMVKNRHLARSISDVGIGKFYDILAYKCKWYGINLIKIGRFEASSKTCACCGFVNQLLTLADRQWHCEQCGKEHDRDLNAANNIKIFGLKNPLPQELRKVRSVEQPLVDDRSVMSLKSNVAVKQKKRRAIDAPKPLSL